MDDDQIAALVELGLSLFEAVEKRNTEEIDELLKADAPLWYQEPETGWTALHMAAHLEDVGTVKKLLDHSAIWNAGTGMLLYPLEGYEYSNKLRGYSRCMWIHCWRYRIITE
jgi:ankyrin repeat protein